MIYFQDPRTKVHIEAWGAVVRTPNGLVFLNVQQTSYLMGLNDVKEIKFSKGEQLPKDLQYLVDKEVVLEIDDEEAELARTRATN